MSFVLKDGEIGQEIRRVWQVAILAKHDGEMVKEEGSKKEKKSIVQE